MSRSRDTPAAVALLERAQHIADTRRRALHGLVSGAFQLLLPLQWLGSALLQSIAGAQSGSCSPAPTLWVALGLSTLINGATFVAIQRRREHRSTPYLIATSQVLFQSLLLWMGAGGFDTDFYLFVSLGFLAFYRDWRLLLGVGLICIGTQYGYATLLCTGAGTPAPFIAWVLLECGVLTLVCYRGNLLLRSIGLEQAQVELEREDQHRQLLERTHQLEATSEQYRALLESTSAVPWELDDSNGTCRYIGAQVQQQWGWPPERFQESSFLFTRIHPDDRPAFAQALEEAAASHDVTVECRLQLSSQQYAHVRSFMRHAPGAPGRLVRGISIDITTQKKLEKELYQAQKLESVGRLAAGIAHEINTPVQFVSDSCYFLRDAVAQVNDVLRAYQESFAALAAGTLTVTGARERIELVEQTADLSFLTENMPPAVDRSLEGLERVATIVRSMKEFSHPTQTAMSSADLNAAIRSTLTVARNEYKYVADVETHLGEIPLVVCNVGEFNQVFLNIIVNAAHAVGDIVNGTERRGLITVTTRADGDGVIISVEDTGGGIPEALQANIFDPFFTTKEVGKGTGQGLAIARSVIVDKHHGTLTFESVPGVGTTFFIRLPINSGATTDAIAA